MINMENYENIVEENTEIKEAVEEGEIPLSRYESYKSMTEEVKKWQK